MKIYNIILSTLLSVFISCSSVSSPILGDDTTSSGNNSSNDNNSGSSGNGGNTTISKKTMFFEFKFDGEAYKYWTYIDGNGNGLRDILFQIEGTTKTYIFRAKNGMEGYSHSTMFSKNMGMEYDIPFFIGDSVLKKEYNSSDTTVSFSPKISFGMSISSSSDALQGVGVTSVYKTPFVVYLKDYDENIHTNVARFNVHHYQIEKELYPGGPVLPTIDSVLKFIEFKNK